MMIVAAIFVIIILFVITVPFLKAYHKGNAAIAAVAAIAIISSYYAVIALFGYDTAFIFPGSVVTGEIKILIDPLAAWFMLIINFTFITSVVYGSGYIRSYHEDRANITLHWISFLLAHASLLALCIVRNSVVFLVLWEVMAMSTFLLVIFEGRKSQVIKAGINYLIQSHVAVLLLTIAFLWIASGVKSYSFDDFRDFSAALKPGSQYILMLLFFAGFGFKAGFIPFHSWLPHTHPAAPSHVSGMMSGVLIKIGIYGILRMLLELTFDVKTIGYTILIISILTGLYGVMLAIIQHNLKRLLAYHSIENIGIIGIGIGIGCLGTGMGNSVMASLGFAGALLHTLNHSLFKSLLFYSAGNINRQFHSMNIEKFGGLIKYFPHTAILFLIASLAICGLPPFNGFVSEFMIYMGLFNGTSMAPFPNTLVFILAVIGLALIGGLAILCFTKAFGIIFLGTPRSEYASININEKHWTSMAPMYLVFMVIMAIGLFPQVFMKWLQLPLQQFTDITQVYAPATGLTIINQIGFYSLIFIAIAALVFALRTLVVRKSKITKDSTWGCGYVGNADKMQYTASSYIRNYRKLAEPLLQVRKNKMEVKGIFPDEAWHHTHPLDRIEEALIKKPLKIFQHFLFRFSFLQNGRLQFYVLYGLVFMGLFVLLPLLLSFINRIFTN